MNKYNIIITSSGFNDINNYVSDNIKRLFTNVSKDKKIMILANAAPKGTGNYVARDNVRNNFLSIGAKEVDIVDLNNNNLSFILNYDIIYCLGGDPSYLIELTKNSNFKKNLLIFLKHGLYIGESAGSMILSDDLKWAYTVKKGTKPKYDIELNSYSGLGMIDYYIFPHWNKVDELVKTNAYKYEKENNIEFRKMNDGDYITIMYSAN